MFKLGKTPARPGAIKLRFGTYFSAAELPAVPLAFGHPWLVQAWRMLGNDLYGDCVWAGAAHETMLLKADAGYPVPLFTNTAVLGDYSAVTGFRTSDPSTDQGTDVQVAAAFRQKTGILDASGQRHTIDVYTALEVGNLDEIALAAFLNGAVGVGVNLPSNAIDQFKAAEPWSIVAGAGSEGGHYVPVVGRNSLGNFLCVSWGRLQAITPAWLAQNMDEGVAYLSLERLTAKGLSPQGYDAATLKSDFQTVTA